MTIDEAIKILSSKQNSPRANFLSNTLDAIKLGIEALKRLQKTRVLDDVIDIAPLRGETKD